MTIVDNLLCGKEKYEKLKFSVLMGN